MYDTRSTRLERIDIGDYTPAEYARFLREIAFINRLLGDNRALRKTLLRRVEREDLKKFSVLDVGAGSGELLRTIAAFARKQNREARLFGLELNETSALSILSASKDYAEIESIRGDALALPFADSAVDFVICSLFTHHFADENVVRLLREFDRVARRGIFVIDLHRHRAAYHLYKLFCFAFGISPLVRDDGSLSVLRSFVPKEFEELARRAGLEDYKVEKIAPYRLVLQTL